MLKKKLMKIQFVNTKTQFENAKTQKTAQVVAWTCLDRRTKKIPALPKIGEKGCFLNLSMSDCTY